MKFATWCSSNRILLFKPYLISFFFWPFILCSIILRSSINTCCRERAQCYSKPVHILNTIFIIAFNWFCFSRRAKKKETTNIKQNPNIFFCVVFFIKEIGSWLIDTSPVLSFWWQRRENSLFIAYVDKFFHPCVRGCDKARIRLNI